MSEPARHQLAAWQRWRMDELATPRPAKAPAGHAADADADAAAFQHQQELQTLRDQARQAARKEGYAAGVAAGHTEGYTKGLAEGRAEGERQLAKRQQELLQPLVPLVEGLREALDRLDTDVGDTLADLTLAAAQKLAGDALDAHPDHIRTLIRALLREEPLFHGHPQLRLHPEDAVLVDASLTKELDAAGWKIQPDATLTRGGCRVTGPEGELNATREARWQALLERARRHGSTPLGDTEAEDAPEPTA